MCPGSIVCVAYHVGSKNERPGRTGFAHFFEHMMFRGTKNVPNYDIPLQETGAQSNAFTTEDMTVYFETVPSQFLERALISRPSGWRFFPPRSIRTSSTPSARSSRTSGGKSYRNMPYGLVEETILAECLSQGTPLFLVGDRLDERPE